MTLERNGRPIMEQQHAETRLDDLLREFLMSTKDSFLSSHPVNVVDGLFAIANAINGLSGSIDILLDAIDKANRKDPPG